jgi:hypothetical protein
MEPPDIANQPIRNGEPAPPQGYCFICKEQRRPKDPWRFEIALSSQQASLCLERGAGAFSSREFRSTRSTAKEESRPSTAERLVRCAVVWPHGSCAAMSSFLGECSCGLRAPVDVALFHPFLIRRITSWYEDDVITQYLYMQSRVLLLVEESSPTPTTRQSIGPGRFVGRLRREPWVRTLASGDRRLCGTHAVATSSGTHTSHVSKYSSGPPFFVRLDSRRIRPAACRAAIS